MEDAGIIELFFERSEQGIRELDIKYGKACRKLSYNIVNDRQDAEECVNDAYLGAWNAIPPVKPDPLLTYICKIVRNISLNLYHRKEAAFMRRYWFSDSCRDIAGFMGLTEKNVSVRLTRIREKLRQYLIEREVFI